MRLIKLSPYAKDIFTRFSDSAKVFFNRLMGFSSVTEWGVCTGCTPPNTHLEQNHENVLNQVLQERFLLKIQCFRISFSLYVTYYTKKSTRCRLSKQFILARLPWLCWPPLWCREVRSSRGSTYGFGVAEAQLFSFFWKRTWSWERLDNHKTLCWTRRSLVATSSWTPICTSSKTSSRSVVMCKMCFTFCSSASAASSSQWGGNRLTTHSSISRVWKSVVLSELSVPPTGRFSRYGPEDLLVWAWVGCFRTKR